MHPRSTTIIINTAVYHWEYGKYTTPALRISAGINLYSLDVTWARTGIDPGVRLKEPPTATGNVRFGVA